MGSLTDRPGGATESHALTLHHRGEEQDKPVLRRQSSYGSQTSYSGRTTCGMQPKITIQYVDAAKPVSGHFALTRYSVDTWVSLGTLPIIHPIYDHRNPPRVLLPGIAHLDG